MSDNAHIDAQDIWATPLFSFTLPDHDFLKDDLITHIRHSEKQQGRAIDSLVAETAKHNLSESTFDFLDSEDPTVMELRRLLEEAILEVVTDLNQTFWPDGAEAESHIIESWYHVTKSGGYHDMHSHPNCSWCGIYYLDPGNTSETDSIGGKNRFYDPRVNADHFGDPATAYIGGHGVWDITPQSGQVVLFPSYLKHSALPYFGKQDRIVIAFNSITELY
ncbi:hypothetical protein GV054_15410 [Marinomonas mediterranea]|jgi:hypothetical protein|uniref:2OG-Fe(II) oxygenase n=1 Tax=Marinomonas mediterranea (strain ATCC 700492 / JCM 21426 / NBRC 103028 / MMB-1) TaxID=717774 RepID=F2K299_MARM1|nr:putative 2OG-Fe(II) oxygenase [Marinomonas mediterranea]ADZ92279.1 hypothetical protein Marme_3060 [Marinomonas mediterranea MMB-1]WCN14278.1 hypothetical protein GV054_15410 [Marinomonas mediterranea]WCN18330.1 hypothetical protein GV053_15475 [Marinomonas mediterranea MMB-1]